jgi:cytochrome c556
MRSVANHLARLGYVVGLSEKMNTYAETLAEVAKDADDVTAIRAHFATLAKICSGCHEDFRQEN